MYWKEAAEMKHQEPYKDGYYSARGELIKRLKESLRQFGLSKAKTFVWNMKLIKRYDLDILRSN